MKTLKMLLVLLFISSSSIIFAQKKSDSVMVWGNCEMCQTKIEKAAKAAGATSAKWDVDSKMLSVSYNQEKSSLDKIEKAIASVGYDTERQIATDKAYKRLPSCCHYERRAN